MPDPLLDQPTANRASGPAARASDDSSDEAVMLQVRTALQSLDAKTPDTAVDLANGRLFTAGGMVSIPSAGTGTFHLQNPAGSGKLVTLQEYTFGATQIARASFWIDTTPHASSTVVASFNNNRASSATAVAVAKKGTTVGTGGSQLSPELLLPANDSRTEAFPLVLVPGQAISVRVSTSALQTMDFYCSSTWSEDAL